MSFKIGHFHFFDCHVKIEIVCQGSNWSSWKLAEMRAFDKNTQLKVPKYMVVISKITLYCHKDAMLERFSFVPSRNSANFDRWTISVGQVVPEIYPPPISFSHLIDLHRSQWPPRWAQKWRNSANWRRNWIPVWCVPLSFDCYKGNVWFKVVHRGVPKS